MKTRIAITIAGLSLLFAGCAAEQQTPSGPDPVTPNPTQPTNPDPTPSKLQKPVVDAVANTVCTDSVPIAGAAAPGASVFVVGGLATSGLATDAHPSSGRFCLDVTLKPGQENLLELRAQDPVLGLSEAVMVRVTHDKCGAGDDLPKDPAPTVSAKNVALGAKGSSSPSPSKGNESFLTDGDPKTVAEFSGGYLGFAFDGWTTIKLDKLVEVEKIVVRWRDTKGGSSEYFGKEYKVLVSSMSDPGDPNLDNGKWIEIKNISDGDGGMDKFDLKSSKPLAQHVAIWMKQDGSSWTWKETFAVSEIEVWNTPKTTTPPPSTATTNTCASMGI